jgi:hypothetical protein
MLTNSTRHETFLHYGQLRSRNGVPWIDNTVLVENRTDMDCFDAIGLPDLGWIVVDCATHAGSVWNNVFVIVDMVTGELIRNQSNELYEQFKWINRRRLFNYHDPQSGYNYLVRTHLGDGVDISHRDNTYIELIRLDSDMEFDTVAFLDRSFMGMLKLSIVDVQIYKR